MQFHLAPAPHAFGNQGAFIFGHGPPDVQQEMGLRVLAQRLIEELDAASPLRELFQQHHLIDIIARQAVRTCDHHPVNRGLFDAVPQAVEPRSVQRGATISIVAENILCPEGLSLRLYVCGEALDLLFNGLGQGLPLSRYPDIDRCAHASPPPVVPEMVRTWRMARSVWSIAAGIGTLDPSAVPHPPLAGIADVSASGVSWLPSR